MNKQAFAAAYRLSRNGCNKFYLHPLVRSFQYSDGVRECAEAGCYWLLDMLATEAPQAMRKEGETNCLVEVRVQNGKALLALTAADNVPPIWGKVVDFTDMPVGDYVFELVDEGERFSLILITER